MKKSIVLIISVVLLMVVLCTNCQKAQARTTNEILSASLTRVQSGPIMSITESWEGSNIHTPSIVQVGGQLIMYYGGGPDNAIGRATCSLTNPPVSWTKYSSNPVITAGTNGLGGSRMRAGSVIMISGQFYLYYSTEASDGNAKIGVATSSDGLSFQTYSGNPILAEDDSVGDYRCSVPCVIVYDGVYYMYYTTSNQGGSSWVPNQYRVATSSDGLHWTRVGIVHTAGGQSWDSVYTECEKVYVTDDGFIMVFEAFNGDTWSICAATSSSPTGTFTDWPNNPILSGSGGSNWDGVDIATPLIFPVGSNLYMMYQGSSSGGGSYNSNTWLLGLAQFGSNVVPPSPNDTDNNTNQYFIDHLTKQQVFLIAGGLVIFGLIALVANRRHLHT